MRCYVWMRRHPGHQPTGERKKSLVRGDQICISAPKGLRDRVAAAAQAEGISASKWWCRAAELSIGSRPTGDP